MINLVIVGGSDAGISAALRAREVNPTSKITIVLADAFPNYSVCGIPYFFSGEVLDWHYLAHRTVEEISAQGITMLPNHVVQHIDPVGKTVTANAADGAVKQLNYNKLIIGTGARPSKLSSWNLDQPGIFTLRTMGDTLTIEAFMTRHKPQTIAIVGAGYIGLEMAEALTHRGMSVTLLQRTASVLVTLDPELGAIVQTELTKHGITVATGITVEQFVRSAQSIIVTGSNGYSGQFDMVLVCVGVVPNSELAQSAGIDLGLRNAIQVNRRMETNLPDIYAAGDCTETWHRIRNHYDYLPLGSTAHKQGRIAGENAVGGSAEFAGTLGTQVVKIFDLVASRTGLRDDEAQTAGFRPLTVTFEAWDHKVYYPGAHRLTFHLTADQQTHQLLGAQLVGHHDGEVAKRIDIVAAALFHRMTVAELSELDLSYTPPFSSPWDPVQMAAQAWEQQQAQPNSH